MTRRQAIQRAPDSLADAPDLAGRCLFAAYGRALAAEGRAARHNLGAKSLRNPMVAKALCHLRTTNVLRAANA